VEDIQVVGEAANGRDAVDLAGRLRPDVVILEIGLPDVNGIAALNRIRGTHPGVRGLFLAAHKSLTSLGELVNVECVCMEDTPATLVEAIRRVHAGPEDPPADQVAFRALAEQLAARTGMTCLETAVLVRLAESDATNDQIAADLEKLWQRPVTRASIGHALERIMTKLDVEPRTRATLMKAVLTAHGGLHHGHV
jgi:DNA-binding NarL/FixJ family response regulator